jgi:hypothetical protein
MDATDIERIDCAQACLQQARAESSEASTSSLASELMYHLDMMLRVITSIRVMSGELDDVELAVTPRPGVLLPRSQALTSAHEDDGQRIVMTVESAIAFHEWSIPGPHIRGSTNLSGVVGPIGD